MKPWTMATLAALCVAALSACGGGGDGAVGATRPQALAEPVRPGDPVARPLDRYLGTYMACDQEHERLEVTLTQAGDGLYRLMPRSSYFVNPDCTGELIAVATWEVPLDVEYLATDTVPVHGTGLPASVVIDQIRLRSFATRRMVSGPDGSGECLQLGETVRCLDLDIEERVVDGGLYLSEAGMRLLALRNDSYEADEEVYVRQ